MIKINEFDSLWNDWWENIDGFSSDRWQPNQTEPTNPAKCVVSWPHRLQLWYDIPRPSSSFHPIPSHALPFHPVHLTIPMGIYQFISKFHSHHFTSQCNLNPHLVTVSHRRMRLIESFIRKVLRFSTSFESETRWTPDWKKYSVF